MADFNQSNEIVQPYRTSPARRLRNLTTIEMNPQPQLDVQFSQRKLIQTHRNIDQTQEPPQRDLNHHQVEALAIQQDLLNLQTAMAKLSSQRKPISKSGLKPGTLFLMHFSFLVSV